jgi:hypothetical protein
VISAEKQLVAVFTDLSTGEGDYPAIRILTQPLNKMTGGAPRNQQRLAAVALYEADPKQSDHWATFHPKVVNCVTTNVESIQRAVGSIPEQDWEEFMGFLERLPRKTAGLHRLW